MPSLVPEDLTVSGTHALVIGISNYLHFADGPAPTPDGSAFQMEQLSGAARSASEFAAWLLEEYRCPRAPLRSLRVLLSPVAEEPIAPEIAAKLNGDFSARLANIRVALNEFRHACDASTDNVGIVYVAGHGVQLTKHGAIVLLSDFGDTSHVARLEGAIDMAGVHAGFNHPGTARTQFWFVDSCRQKPAIARRFESLEGALKLDVPIGDTETSPIFLAATSGAVAYARVGGVTLLNEALLWALRGGAVAGPDDESVDSWHVPVTALIQRLPKRVKVLALAEGVEQSVDIAGKVHEAVMHEFADAPQVELHVDVFPEQARFVSRGTLKQDGQIVIVDDFAAWPLQRYVDAGLYLFSVETGAPFVNRSEVLNVKPPLRVAKVDVNP